MKKIISLIIISIFIKGYINECTLSGTTCSGEVEGVTKCVYDETTSQCLEKTLCDKVDEPSEINCQGATTLNPKATKCVFESSETKCDVKTLCEIDQEKILVKKFQCHLIQKSVFMIQDPV